MADVAHARRSGKVLERALLACGVVGPPLFVVVFLVAGLSRPDYSPLRHPVSSLALSESGWVQVANFLVTGALVLAFAVGLRPALRQYGWGIWAPLLVGLVGVGLIGSGLFPTDPISGYPPGTPMEPEGSTQNALHNAFAIPVFWGLPAACFVSAYRFARAGRRGLARYSVGTAVVFIIGVVLYSAAFDQDPTLVSVAGLLQRLTIIVGWAWLTVLALHLLRRASETPLGDHPDA